MAQDRTHALFGDSPPPKRQPAPYPEGDIIYECNSRRVVRHGDTITKYIISPHGFGVHDHPNESLALRFIKEHTTIPVPEVISSDWDRITMEYIEGQTLKEAWPTLTLDQRSEILAQLRDYIAQMRRLGGIYLGRVDGQGVVVPSIFTRSGGPFRIMSELHDWLVRPRIRLEAESMYWHQITTHLGAEYPIVFTHRDIAARNILVSGGVLLRFSTGNLQGGIQTTGTMFLLCGGWITLTGRHSANTFPLCLLNAAIWNTSLSNSSSGFPKNRIPNCPLQLEPRPPKAKAYVVGNSALVVIRYNGVLGNLQPQHDLRLSLRM